MSTQSSNWREAKIKAFERVVHLHDVLYVDGGDRNKFFDDVHSVVRKYFNEYAAIEQLDKLNNQQPNDSDLGGVKCSHKNQTFLA